MEKKIVKQEGFKEELDEGKLWDSIYYPARESHYNEDQAVDLADKAKHRVMEWINEHEDDTLTSGEIRDKVVEVLEEIDEDVCFMYEKHLDIN
ncbi:MAG: transcriptional regulator NrdR family protein [Candidatus Nanohaloarchaea archaeon]|jgi:transcriptional regulator NrdR family protein